MTAPVLFRTFDLPDVDRREVFRYAGVASPDDAVNRELDACLALLPPTLRGSVVWAVYDVVRKDDVLDLGFAKTSSRDLARALDGCDRVCVFAATASLLFDRLVRQHETVSPARALLCGALGSERVEALCDTFCDYLSGTYTTHPRFSPGYGDLPLTLQKDLFAALGVTKRLGVALSESLLMTPTKSVTALVGITGDQ